MPSLKKRCDTKFYLLSPLEMATHETPPAKQSYRVWADEVRRVFQDVEVDSPKQAHEIANAQPESWQRCEEHENNALRVSNEVQDLATQEYARIDGSTHCKTCGSEIVETITDSVFSEGECGPCEYRRYVTQPVLLELARTFRQECSDRIRQYRDDLEEDFGDPDDIQEAVGYWKDLRDQCDAALGKADTPQDAPSPHSPRTEMANKETAPEEKTCRQCGHTPTLGGKRLDPGECNVCVVVEETLEAYGDVLVKHFPEAKYGDQSPLVLHALQEALASAAAEWIDNNFPQEDDGQAA